MNQDAVVAVRRPSASARVVIQSGARQPLFAPAELWTHREVLYALVRKEMKVRYAQTVAGAAWVILQPLLTTVVLSIVARRWMNMPADHLPYPLFVYGSLVPWMYFTHVLTKSTVSLLGTGLLSKVYFPRLLLPLAAAIAGLIDLLVASTILGCLMIVYGIAPSAILAALPGALLLAVAVSFGFGVWLAALNLFHRDIAYALPFLTQLLFFVTPVAYPTSVIPPSWRLLCSLNPLVAVIECWRWTVLAVPVHLSPLQLAVSLAVGAAVIVSGLWYFSRHEPFFADVGET